MAIAKMTSKGQVTIPKDIRDRFGLVSGDELEFVEVDGQLHVRRHIRHSPFQGYRGFLKDESRRSSDAIVKELRGHEP